MLKKFTLILTIVLLSTTLSKAQWTNQGAFPDTTFKGQNHAMAVDPDGKIWVGRYQSTAKYSPTPGDTLKKSVYLIFVFNPNGTQAAFSPIWKIGTDTLLTTNRGMRTNIDGNILMLTGNTPTPNYMYSINYKTGAMVHRVQLKYTAAAPCVAKNTGTIFVAPVVAGPTSPMEMYDQNFNLIGNALGSTVGFSRSFEVSHDGNTIYWSGYTNGKIYVYNRADEFSSFSLKDSILIGVHSESLTWNPKTDYLWVAGGSYNDMPTGPYTPGTWYAYNFATKTVVDSLKWTFKVAKSVNERPRALAFSNDGNTAYIGCFGTSGYPLVQKLVKGGTDVKQIDQIPTGYDLSQNYPNPFNPTTNIQFSIPEQGFVSLKVYNVLGEEVASLVNEIKSAGTYKVDFDASKLSSGVYLYTLSTGKFMLSKKMILMK